MGGKGRAPCCDKSKVKRGPWSPSEDLRLIAFIQKNGHHNWRALPKQAGLLRCGKSCRLRWINYLRPDVKRGNFTKEEEDTIINLHRSLGNKWSKIASYLPGRTDNEIKNIWNTHLKKKLVRNLSDIDDHDQTGGSPITSSLSSSSASCGRLSAKLDDADHSDGIKENIDPQEGNSSAAKPHDTDLIAEDSMMPIKELPSSSTSCELQNHHPRDMLCDFREMFFEETQEVNKPLFPDHHLMDIWCEIGATCLETNGAVQEVDKQHSPDIPLDQYRQMDMSCEFGRTCYKTNSAIQDETNKSESLLEFDTEFWNRLEGLGSFATGNVDSDVHKCPNSSGDFGPDNEYKEWLEYLEDRNYYDYSLMGGEGVDPTLDTFHTSHSV